MKKYTKSNKRYKRYILFHKETKKVLCFFLKKYTPNCEEVKINMELHLGKMSGQELAQWFNIAYTTYKRNPSKYIAKLDDYCKYSPVRGGVIVEEIYIATYDKKINKKIDTIYV